MSATYLADVEEDVERVLSEAGLGLVLTDRIDLLSTGDEHLHRGVVVSVTQTTNTNQTRNRDLARVVDTVTVQTAYRLRPGDRRDDRKAAYVLEEQVRVALTSTVCVWGEHLTYVSATRAPAGQDGQWMITTQTYTTRRDAALGGQNG